MKRAIGAELWKSEVPGPTKERECHLVRHRGEGTGRAASWLRQLRSAPDPLYCSRECGGIIVRRDRRTSCGDWSFGGSEFGFVGRQ